MTTEPKAEQGPTTTAANAALAVGVVTSDKMNKTRRVEIPRLVKHPRYGKYIRGGPSATSTTRTNESHIGDTVEIMETPAAVARRSTGGWCASSRKAAGAPAAGRRARHGAGRRSGRAVTSQESG